MHLAFLHSLIFFALALAPYLAHAANPDEAAKTEGFQKGEAFSVRKAMMVIFGNVDEQNCSTLKSDEKLHQYGSRFGCHDVQSLTATAVECKAFTLNNVETLYLATSAIPLLEGGKGVCSAAYPSIGLHIFKKNDDRWELSASVNHFSEVGYDRDPTFDFVKIGKDQVALAVNDGFHDKYRSWRWTTLYCLVDGDIERIFNERVYNVILGNCSNKKIPGEPYVDSDHTEVYLDEEPSSLPKEELAASLDICSRLKTDIYFFPSDLKFYNLKMITSNTIGWKDSDGKLIMQENVESDLLFDHGIYAKYHPIPTTEPLVPLLGEDSNYQKRRQSLEKDPKYVKN